MENRGAEKPDDLEIASIGSLYVGPWDKKYWSCSRGKDRYPYPVGYRAIRTHAGYACQMEVCEGLKGPLFVITTVDGSSFNGQTPDIAWENFQRSCPKAKNWNGKRFSNKIDGAEFFGLKNPCVQRLLRELVNNVNLAQGSSFSSLFFNGSKIMDQTHPQVSDQNHTLLSALEEQDISVKRIRKKRNASKVNIREARLKRICNQDLQNDSKTHILQQISDPCSLSPDSNAVQLTRKLIACSHNEDSANEGIASHHHTPTSSIVSSIMHVKAPALQYQEEVGTISNANSNINEANGLIMQGAGEVSCHLVQASNKNPMGLDCSDSIVDKYIISQSKSNSDEAEAILVTTGLDKSNNAIKIQLDRCPDAEIELENPDSLAPRGDNGEIMALACSSGGYISDTCDTVIGKNCNGTSFDVSEFVVSALNHSNEIFVKNELIAVDPLSRTSKCHSSEVVSKSVFRGLTSRTNLCASEPSHLTPHDPCIPEDAILQGVAKDSLPEVGSSGSIGRGVEEVDLDLAGQELAKSMMAFLLPQAVPLLKKTYSRRRSRTKLLKTIDPCYTLTGENTPHPNAVNGQLNNIIPQGNLVAGLAQLPEMNIQESIYASKTLSQAASPEPFSVDRSSKVIPDSFENEIGLYDSFIKEHSCMVFDNSDPAPQDDMKGNSDSSSLPIAVVEEVDKLLKCYYQSDAYNKKAPTSDRKDVLVNSTIIVVEPAKIIPTVEGTNEESMKNIVKYSNHLTENFSSLDDGFIMQNSFQHFNHETERNAEEVSLQVTPGKHPNKDEKFVQSPPASCHILGNLIDNDVSKEVFDRLNTRSIQEKSGSFSPIEVANIGDHRNNKGEQISDDNYSLPCMPKCEMVTEVISNDTNKAQIFNSLLSVQCKAPLSETLLCRNLNNSIAPNMNFSKNSILPPENYQSSHINKNANSMMLSVYKAKFKKPKNNLRDVPNVSKLETNWCIPSDVAFQSQDLDKNFTGIFEVANQADPSSLCFSKDSMNVISQVSAPAMCSLLQIKEETKAIPELNSESTYKQLQPSHKDFLMETLSHSHKSPVMQSAANNGHKDLSHGVLCKKSLLDGSLAKELSWNEGDKHMELVGSYLHPEPILSVLISTDRNQLQIVVLCGFPEETNRHLFMYDVSLQNQRGCPTFIGYTPLLLPFARSQWNTNIPFERSTLQLAPDGRSIIFVSSIKAPRCREQKISCLCSNCKPESSKGTNVEIFHVNFGYVSRMTKLSTIGEISCILVCEPTYLIAVEENRGLHAWVMNLTWSENLEEFMLPTFDLISPLILELKGIPNCNSLVIGHNGLGDFGIWELTKRVFLAKFSSPKSTIYQIIPISVFNWQMNSNFSAHPQSAKYIMESMQKSNCKISLGSSFENMAIWILISAANFETEFEGNGLGRGLTGLWRLALMTKNTIIMGNILDPRATAIDASADSGLIGTSDGSFYKWELSSGRKLGNLTSIQCGVSCVALDGKTGALAVGGTDDRLRVFIDS